MFSGSRITAGLDTLFDQASATAQTYLMKGIRDIDDALGKGYAAKHPELLGQYMLTCAADLHTSIVGRALELLSDEGTERIALAIRELKGEE